MDATDSRREQEPKGAGDARSAPQEPQRDRQRATAGPTAAVADPCGAPDAALEEPGYGHGV
ncbi:MAG TPA: hypothetical protein VNK92_00195 [Vicinamibacterales bacterium]|nr:hypothetical protein [Vicinamibacterales bacterium]